MVIEEKRLTMKKNIAKKKRIQFALLLWEWTSPPAAGINIRMLINL